MAVSFSKMEILNINAPVIEDESITRFEYHNVVPYSSNAYNNNDEIRFKIHQQDIISLPCESRLFFEGTLASAEALVPGDGLVNNAMAHLFSEIRFELNGVVVDRVRNPGITSLMKNLASFSTHDMVRMGNSSFAIDYPQDEKFSFCVPLKTLSGFFEDYQKVLVHASQELILVRSRTDTNAYVDTVGDKNIELTLNIIQWQVPFLSVNDSYRLNLLNVLQQKRPLQIGFRSWQLYEYPNISHTTSSISWPVRLSSATEKPRFLIVGFQTDRKDKLKVSASRFDTCDIRQMRLFVGSECYPYVPLTADFNNKQFAVLYENFLNFRKKYYQYPFDNSGTIVTRKEFSDTYPLWIIDCSHQSEVVKVGAVDVRLDIDSTKNFPQNTTAYCLILSDSLFEYIPFLGLVRQMH